MKKKEVQVKMKRKEVLNKKKKIFFHFIKKQMSRRGKPKDVSNLDENKYNSYLQRKPKAGSNLDIDKYNEYLKRIITLLKNELSKKEHELSEKHEFFSERKSELLNELEIYIIDASTEGVKHRSGGKTPLPNSLILFKFPSILYVARIEFKPSHSNIRQELANINFNLVDDKMISSRIWNTTTNGYVNNHIHNKGQWDTVTDLPNRKLYSIVKEYQDSGSIKCVFVDTEILRSDFNGDINLNLSDVSNFIVAKIIEENLEELPSLLETSVAAPSLSEDPPLILDPKYDIYKEEEPLTMEEIQELLKKSEKKSDSGVKRRSTKRKRSISRRRSAKRKRSMSRKSGSKRVSTSRRSGSKRRSMRKRL